MRSLHGGSKAARHALHEKLGFPPDALPNLGSWKADAGFLSLLAEYILKSRPGCIVELGMGASTLLLGVLTNISVSSYLVDAIIGLSVVYKALDNMGAYQRWFGFQPSTKAATMIFGLFHGFGLATKLQDFTLSKDGLVPNMLAFNVGVEIGQLLALAGILIVMAFWRRTAAFTRQAFAANVILMTAGFLLTGYQLAGYFQS